jgi:hypothetical protein
MHIPVLQSLLLLLVLLLSSILTTSRETNGERQVGAQDLQPNHVRRRDLWQTQARVVGGHAALSGEFPNFVELSNGCGGALIHDDLVLTAGTSENHGLLYSHFIATHWIDI